MLDFQPLGTKERGQNFIPIITTGREEAANVSIKNIQLSKVKNVSFYTSEQVSHSFPLSI